MTAFEILIDDIFSNKDFIDKFTVDGMEVACVVSQITEKETYTAFGLDDGISFYLQVKSSDYKPSKADKIIFKGGTYKVDYFVLDSAGLTYSVYLKALSTK